VISPRYSWSFVANFRGEFYNAKVYSFVDDEANIFLSSLFANRNLGDESSITSRKCRTRLLFHARELMTRKAHTSLSLRSSRRKTRATLEFRGARPCANFLRINIDRSRYVGRGSAPLGVLPLLLPRLFAVLSLSAENL